MRSPQVFSRSLKLPTLFKTSLQKTLQLGPWRLCITRFSALGLEVDLGKGQGWQFGLQWPTLGWMRKAFEVFLEHSDPQQRRLAPQPSMAFSVESPSRTSLGERFVPNFTESSSRWLASRATLDARAASELSPPFSEEEQRDVAAEAQGSISTLYERSCRGRCSWSKEVSPLVNRLLGLCARYELTSLPAQPAEMRVLKGFFREEAQLARMLLAHQTILGPLALLNDFAHFFKGRLQQQSLKKIAQLFPLGHQRWQNYLASSSRATTSFSQKSQKAIEALSQGRLASPARLDWERLGEWAEGMHHPLHQVKGTQEATLWLLLLAMLPLSGPHFEDLNTALERMNEEDLFAWVDDCLMQNLECLSSGLFKMGGQEGLFGKLIYAVMVSWFPDGDFWRAWAMHSWTANGIRRQHRGDENLRLKVFYQNWDGLKKHQEQWVPHFILRAQKLTEVLQSFEGWEGIEEENFPLGLNLEFNALSKDFVRQGLVASGFLRGWRKQRRTLPPKLLRWGARRCHQIHELAHWCLYQERAEELTTLAEFLRGELPRVFERLPRIRPFSAASSSPFPLNDPLLSEDSEKREEPQLFFLLLPEVYKKAMPGPLLVEEANFPSPREVDPIQDTKQSPTPPNPETELSLVRRVADEVSAWALSGPSQGGLVRSDPLQLQNKTAQVSSLTWQTRTGLVLSPFYQGRNQMGLSRAPKSQLAIWQPDTPLFPVHQFLDMLNDWTYCNFKYGLIRLVCKVGHPLWDGLRQLAHHTGMDFPGHEILEQVHRWTYVTFRHARLRLICSVGHPLWDWFRQLLHHLELNRRLRFLKISQSF